MRDEFSPQPAGRLGFEQRRHEVFLVAFIGYAACYLVRGNTAVVSEIMVRERGWTAVQLGVLLSAFPVTYGLGKLVMGLLADRMSLRIGFAGALIASALVCILLAFAPDAATLALGLGLIGLLQGLSAPAALAVLGAWYPPWTRGSRVAVWNISQNVGAAALPLLISVVLLVAGPGAWQGAYWVPGLVALAVGFWCLARGGDRPWREGRPTLPELYGSDALPRVPGSGEASYWRLVRVHVMGSGLLWRLLIVNALLYLVRFSISTWIPFYLISEHGHGQHDVALVLALFEWGAIPGALAFAFVARQWPNRTAWAAAFAVLVLAAVIVVYSQVHTLADFWVVSLLLGALTYGPQVVVNILTLNFVSPRAVGVAVGFVSLGGYLGGQVVANVGIPLVAGEASWGAAFLLVAGAALVAAAVLLSLRGQEQRFVTAGRPAGG